VQWPDTIAQAFCKSYLTGVLASGTDFAAMMLSNFRFCTVGTGCGFTVLQ